MINEKLFKQIEKVMPIVSINMIIQKTGGRYLIAKRTNEPAKGEYWLIGGRILHGEDIISAIKRITKKELGLVLERYHFPPPLLSVSSSLFKTRHTIELNYYFLLREEEITQITLNDEHTDYQWVRMGDERIQHVKPYINGRYLIFCDFTDL